MMAKDQVMGGVVIPPAQQVTREETGESETKRVDQQWWQAVVKSELAYGATLAILGIIGQSLRWVMLGAGLVVIGYAGVQMWRQVQVTSRRAIIVILVMFIAAWSSCQGALFDFLWRWELVWRVIAIGALLIFIANCIPYIWRMQVEIQNPNWPPPLLPRAAWNGGIGGLLARYQDPDIEPVEPSEMPETMDWVGVEIVERDDNGTLREIRRSFLPVSGPTMAAIAELVLVEGMTFSAENLSGNGKPLSGRKGEYEPLRDAMLEAGQLRWRVAGSPTQGVEVTSKGRAVLRGALERYDTEV